MSFQGHIMDTEVEKIWHPCVFCYQSRLWPISTLLLVVQVYVLIQIVQSINQSIKTLIL